MYTSFCQDCKSALSSLWASVEKIHAQQTRNDNDFRDAIAEERNAKLEADKKAAVAAAKERINAIMDKATEDAATLDALTPLDIDPDSKADKRILTLLGGQFTLDSAQLQHIVDEYVGGNRALLNAIATYAESHGMRLIRATAESRRSGIESIRAGALGLVSRIEATSYRNQGKEYDVPLMVRDFCVDGDFAAATGIYDRIGQKYSGELVPARVEPENPLNFHFRGVRDAEQKAG